jgi:transposase
MALAYRVVDRDQQFLMPPDMREWLPADHLVWFLLETLGELDTSAFHTRHANDGVGRAAYDPDMLLALLVYGYCRGVRSSRAMERLCEVDVAFRVVCAGDIPDHSTIARFRAVHEDVFSSVFTQVLAVAARAGLAWFGTVAIDGTKIAANASLDANRGAEWLRAEVEAIVAEAAATDAAEDAAHGPARGDEMPEELRTPGPRAARIAAAAAELAAETAAAAERAAAADAEAERVAADRLARLAAGEKVAGRYPRGADRVAEATARLEGLVAAQDAKIEAFADRVAAAIAAGRPGPDGRAPTPTDQCRHIAKAREAVAAAQAHVEAPRQAAEAEPVRVNLTDPASRVMPTRKGWIQGYNAQLAVTADQIIVAVGLGQNPADTGAFLPMMRAAQDAADAAARITGSPDQTIGTVLADAGYPSQDNLTAPGPDRLIALGKTREVDKAAATRPAVGDPPEGATARQVMDHRLRTAEGAALYKRRGATVEPGIGNLKKILDRFSRRGLAAATSELHLAAAAANLLKIHRTSPVAA